MSERQDELIAYKNEKIKLSELEKEIIEQEKNNGLEK